MQKELENDKKMKRGSVMLKEFIFDESGVETMEWIAILTVAAVLIAVCVGLGKKMKSKTKNLANKI